MILKLKLANATYEMAMETSCMTVSCTTWSEIIKGKKTEAGFVTSNLGYYGPAQVDLAITRIIAQETTLEPEKVGLKEYLKRSRAIADEVMREVQSLKETIKQSKQIEA